MSLFYESCFLTRYTSHRRPKPAESYLSFEELSGALELATMWECDGMQRAIFTELDSRLHGPLAEARRIALGVKYAGLYGWVYPAYLSLALREEPLSLDEEDVLGAAHVAELKTLRVGTIGEARGYHRTSGAGWLKIAGIKEDKVTVTGRAKAKFSCMWFASACRA